MRRRVRTRDVRFGPRTAAGARGCDTVHTLAATAQKLGVNILCCRSAPPTRQRC